MKFNMKNEETKTLVIVAIIVLAVGGYYFGWFDQFLNKAPEVKILSDQECATVAEQMQDGTFYGGRLYDMSACCVKDNQLMSCNAAESGKLASMTVGGGEVPYDAVVLFLDVINQGVPITASIESINITSVSGQDLTSYVRPSFVQNTSLDFSATFDTLDFSATFDKEVLQNGTAVTCTNNAQCPSDASCKDSKCVKTGTMTISKSQIYVGQSQAMQSVCPGGINNQCQTIWATVIYLSDNKYVTNPNKGIELDAAGNRRSGEVRFDIAVRGTDPTGRVGSTVQHVPRSLKLGAAALAFGVDLTYGYG